MFLDLVVKYKTCILSLARSKGNDGFDMNYEFPGRSKQNIKIN